MKQVKMKASELVIDPALTKLRPINMMHVNTYRQHYRCGVDMGEIVIEHRTRRVVSGNHRVTALLEEYGPGHEVTVTEMTFATELDLLTEFAKRNMAHGVPLSGFDKKRIMQALSREGSSPEDMANLFGVSVKRLEVWSGMTVSVIGSDGKQTTEPVKNGVYVPDGVMSAEAYEKHAHRDRGVSAHLQASQLSRWLRLGWIDQDDPRTIEALKELSQAITAFFAAREKVTA